MASLLFKPTFGFAKVSMPSCSHVPKAYTGATYDQVLKDRKGHMPGLYFHYYKEPLLIVEGLRNNLWDHTGKRYIDLISGISTVAVGHSHPRISKVVKEQVDTLTHISPIYMHEFQGVYSKMLCEKLGPGFDTVFLANSGGEANDFAIMIAKMFSGSTKFLSLRNGYHGLVGNAQAVTNVGSWNQPVIRGLDHEKLSFPSLYRGLHTSTEGYVREAEEVISTTSSGKIGGFIAEPIMGVGGINPLPQGYLKHVYEVVRRHGGLCIADEVQTGFGRVGNDFWGFKMAGVQPDIVTMAKGIGNGFPLAAVATRREVADVVKKTFFNTFAGGPIQCRVGMEVLRIIEDQKLANNAEEVGTYLLGRLREIQAKSDHIGDVRGKGLMIGVEIVKTKESKVPDLEKINWFMEKSREAGLLFGKGGSLGNVLRIQPPLTLTRHDAEYVAGVVEELLAR